MTSTEGKRLLSASSSTDEPACKRSRSSSKSDRKSERIPSGSSSEKEIERYQSEWSSSKSKKVLPTQFICLYDLDADIFLSPSDVPVYIRKGGNAIVLECSEFVQDESAFVPVKSLTKEQKQRMDCVVACARVMFTDLLLCEEDKYYGTVKETINNWKEKTSNYLERKEKSFQIELKTCKSAFITRCMTKFYYALVNGFHSGYAREALSKIFELCIFVLTGDLQVSLYVSNIGGSAPGHCGSSEIGKVTHKLEKGWTPTERKKEAEEVLNVDELTENHVYVPDVIIHNDEDKPRYFLFAECKSFSESKLQAGHWENVTVVNTLGKTMKSQVWHQCLRGLFDYDCVYGCAINGCEAMLLKLEVTDDKLKTTTTQFPFFKKERGAEGLFSNFCFDIDEFEHFLMALTKIIESKIKLI